MGIFDSNKNTTTNQTTNNDNRQVITSTSSAYDLSDNSVRNDSSISSTIMNLLDGGAVGGMVDVALAGLNNATRQSLGAYEYADSIFGAATQFADRAGDRQRSAFSAAAAVTSDALTTAQSAYSEAMNGVSNAYGEAQGAVLDAFKSAQIASSGAQAATQAAYADAKGTTDSQKQIILGVLAVAAVIAFASMRKAG